MQRTCSDVLPLVHFIRTAGIPDMRRAVCKSGALLGTTWHQNQLIDNPQIIQAQSLK
jgi:hypothetical protein